MAQNAEHLLLNPCPKKTSFKREYPFPIIGLECKEGQSDSSWKCAEGHLQDNFVLVHDEDSMIRLYKMGFFGKGTMSKNAPRICSQKRTDPLTEPSSKKQKVDAAQVNKEEELNDVIDVIDSDDENSKEGKETENIEVVLSDSSSDDEGKNKSLNSSNAVEKESLQLTFEEAFFLSYGLGCLVVKEKDQMLNLSRLWNKFCELVPDGAFPVMYTAYHHFRSKGWIVKSGIKCGADYVLYKDGPPFYHATYSVVVKSVKEQHLRDIRGGRQFTWASLAALNRVNANAGKGLLLLYVIRPNSMSENKIITPFCVSQFRLEEVLFKRWVASENREEEES